MPPYVPSFLRTPSRGEPVNYLRGMREADMTSHEFKKADEKASLRVWRNLDWSEKGNWKEIERFARHLYVEYGVNISRAYDLSAEYWHGRSS